VRYSFAWAAPLKRRSVGRLAMKNNTPEERLLRAIFAIPDDAVLIDPRPTTATISLGVLPQGAEVEFEKSTWDGRNGETTVTLRISYPRDES
jgi:hypothetical protein